MKRRIAVSLASLALCIGALVVTPAGAAARILNASGGSLTFTTTVRNAKTCVWSSNPAIAGFDVTARCAAGPVRRVAKFGANVSSREKSYTITLTAHGTVTTVHRWNVVERGITTSASFTVTSIDLVLFGAQAKLYGTFHNIPKLTITDNAGDTCSATSVIQSNGEPPYYTCVFPEPLKTEPIEANFTSIKVSSPGLVSKTFSWTHLDPTLAIVANPTGGITVSVTSGTFTGTSTYFMEELSGAPYLMCHDYFSQPSQPNTATCEASESLASTEFTTTVIEVNLESSSYTFESLQGTPVTVLGNPYLYFSLTYHPATNNWY